MEVYTKVKLDEPIMGDVYNSLVSHVKECKVPFEITEAGYNSRSPKKIEIWFRETKKDKRGFDKLLDCVTGLGEVIKFDIVEQTQIGGASPDDTNHDDGTIIYTKVKLDEPIVGDVYQALFSYFQRCNLPFEINEMGYNSRTPKKIEIWFKALNNTNNPDLDRLLDCVSGLGEVIKFE